MFFSKRMHVMIQCTYPAAIERPTASKIRPTMSVVMRIAITVIASTVVIGHSVVVPAVNIELIECLYHH